MCYFMCRSLPVQKMLDYDSSLHAIKAESASLLSLQSSEAKHRATLVVRDSFRLDFGCRRKGAPSGAFSFVKVKPRLNWSEQ